jgi:hypothetical protein
MEALEISGDSAPTQQEIDDQLLEEALTGMSIIFLLAVFTTRITEGY